MIDQSETAADVDAPRVDLLTCPGCGGDAFDLRHVGFSPSAMEQSRTCYVWSDQDYRCRVRFPRVLHVSAVFR